MSYKADVSSVSPSSESDEGRKKRGSVTTDRENEVSKIFIISLGSETFCMATKTNFRI